MAKQGTALAEVEVLPPLRESDDVTTAQLVRLAEAGKLDVGTLERLVAMKVAAEEREARRQYFEAFANLKAELGPVPRTKEGVERVTRNGTSVRLKYAPLDGIENHLRAPCARHGFVYWWNSKLHEDGVWLTVYCNLRHVGGHMEQSEFTFPWRDAAPPKANGVQIAGSARTYGERYSLIEAFGITTADEDVDGQTQGDHSEPVTPEQEAILNAMIRELGTGINLARFLDYLGVDTVAAIPAHEFEKVVKLLEQKRRA